MARTCWCVIAKENMMFAEYLNHDVAVYGGYLLDDSQLIQCASGGVATALCQHFIDQGGYVAGVVYSEDFYNAEYILTRNKLDIKRLMGSKYIECDKNGIYSEIKKLLDAGESVLFFGLPCVVAALYKFVGMRHENLLTCELICHGPTSAVVHKEYIDFLEKRYKSKIVDFSVRRKKNEWKGKGYLFAQFENGKVFEKPFSDTEYSYAFSVLARESCYACRFKGNNRQGDIMIGDFWGATENDSYWNKLGVSSIFAETEKGNNFLQLVSGIRLFPTTFERIVKHNPMVIKSTLRSKNRDKFSRLLSEKGLIYAVNHTADFKYKLIRVLKIVLPRWVKVLGKIIFTKIMIKKKEKV